MPSDALHDRRAADARDALAWEEVRARRDERWRKNAWCVVSLLVVAWAGAGGSMVLPHVAGAPL